MTKKIISSTLFFLAAFIVLFVYAVIFSYLRYFHAAPSFWWIYLIFIFIWELNVYLIPGIRKKFKETRNAFVACWLVLSVLVLVLMLIPLLDLLARFVVALNSPAVFVDIAYQFISIAALGAPSAVLFAVGMVLKCKEEV